MKIGMIGKGAIAQYVMARLGERGHHVSAILVRPEKLTPGRPKEFGAVEDLPSDLDVVIDCAGHSALIAYGPPILSRGVDMISVSLGALADHSTADALKTAAGTGQSTLHLASGAIGALDCLSAARAGTLTAVRYTGRKPPKGWLGSPAEAKVDLTALTEGAVTHFEGSARDAALSYPKNANVAAAVALAGLGFDRTKVSLIADATIDQNMHEIVAEGDFGTFAFQISGNALPDNPRSSALAAMSVLAKLDQISSAISL
ncbi:MAG: aspartate dehydrogenase [Rhodobacteraceae bacterium]|nr:aspartate dehydrogenase [Paracoccaceae bacterium]